MIEVSDQPERRAYYNKEKIRIFFSETMQDRGHFKMPKEERKTLSSKISLSSQNEGEIKAIDEQ